VQKESYHAQIEWFIPVGVECLLDDRGRMSLLASDGGHGERIGETEYIAFVQAVCRDNWEKRVSF
jgi:hypothetical protein